MPVATLRTSDGRQYGQILSEQIYDGSENASTYQVNKSRGPPRPPASEGPRKQPTASLNLFGDVNSTVHQIHRTKAPVPEPSAHRSLDIGDVRHGLSPYQIVGFPDPTFKSLGDRLTNEDTTAGLKDFDRPESLTQAATLQSSSRKSANDDSLGLLKDLSQILSRDETTTPTAAASQNPVPQAENQPRIRDFAASGSAPFLRARAAVRRRSRSVVKVDTHTAGPVPRDRSLNAVTYEGESTNPPGRNPNRIIPGPVEPARPPLAPLLPMTEEQVPETKVSPVINYHSQALSVLPAESTAEDVQSDASSGVISNAQSAVFVKVPPQPGPAPVTPLPSLPEGFNNFTPATPRTSQSSQRFASPGNSPPKIPPPKSPARSYKLYPSLDSSLPKRPGSPIRTNVAVDPGQVMAQPSPPLRSKRRGISFPRADLLPTSMSVGALEELEQWKKERAENTRQKKLGDLARVMSYKAAIEEVKPVTSNTVDGEGYHEGRDSYNAALFPRQHRPQSSHESVRNSTTALPYQDCSTLSQKLSPIIVVAEQEPVSPVQRVPSQKSTISRNSIDGHPRSFKTNGFYPVPPHPASPTLQGPDYEGKVRPVSSHSLPVPRPIASRVPTPHLSPLLQGPSHCSSQRSSVHGVIGLEARLSAMERKNAMLERAFLAVINTSAAFGDSLGLSGMDGADVDRSNGLSARDGDRSSGTSETENRAGARWSVSIGS